jgi:transposase-like protein
MKRIKCPHCGRTFTAPTTQQAKGGRARAANLTPEQRREIAQKAAQARWKPS